jgi:hypothetical protein
VNLLAGGAALVAWLAGRRRGQREACLFVPIVAIFVANSVTNPLNIGVRHALPAYPLFFIAGSPLLTDPLVALARGRRGSTAIVSAALAIASFAWVAFGSFSIAPRYLQNFNEIAGGPENGHRWLIDSNIDWGQDLIRLREYMVAEGIDSVKLAYFGRVNPAVYGIRFEPLEPGSKGIAVVSASLLMGRPYWVWMGPDHYGWARSQTYAWLRTIPPKDRVGALFVYDLGGS